jgi:hypothetical protein
MSVYEDIWTIKPDTVKDNKRVRHGDIFLTYTEMFIGCLYSLLTTTIEIGGPGSSVCIAIDYGLNGPGIKSRWGRDFSRLSRPSLGPTQPPVQWVPGLSRG